MTVKKTIFLTLAVIVLLTAAICAWLLLGSTTAFKGKKYDFYIRTGMGYPEILTGIRTQGIVRFPSLFDRVAQRTGYPAEVKAGKFEILQGMTVIDLVRMLKNGRQSPVNLVITKLRTKQDLAGMVGRKFECDSVSFAGYLTNIDTLKAYGLDSNTVMTTVFPDTYTYFWNTNPTRIFRKLRARADDFWTTERRALAEAKHLNPVSAYILASIVEEETSQAGDKGKIARVYMNRLATGMRLSADPTVKFAMRNFELKRIYTKYLQTESPYNTYRYAGLPPGPICTPAAATIDSVLHAPETKYMYFVARPDFSGVSNFAVTYAEHLANAKAYQKALDEEYRKSRQAGQP